MAQRTTRTRRGRPPSIETSKLLDVAREVFLERGVHATTLEVAHRAGISEGTLFHRFKTKEGLFRAAMRFDMEDLPRWLKEQLDRLVGLELRDALSQLATSMLELGRIALPLMMMEWSNRDWLCHAQSEKNRSVYQQLLRAFGSYFEAQMDAGALRRVDAEVLSRVFIGSLHHYNMTRIFAQGSDPFIVPEGMFVRGLVDLLLEGTLPKTSQAPFSEQIPSLERPAERSSAVGAAQANVASRPKRRR